MPGRLIGTIGTSADQGGLEGRLLIPILIYDRLIQQFPKRYFPPHDPTNDVTHERVIQQCMYQ